MKLLRLFWLLAVALVGCAAQNTCSLSAPERCVGQVAHVTLTSGRETVILVDSVVRNGIEYRASGTTPAASPDLSLIAGTTLDTNTPYIFVLSYASDIRTATGGTEWIDVLLIASIVMLVVVIAFIGIRRPARPFVIAKPSPVSISDARQFILANPLTLFTQRQVVVQDLREADLPLEEIDYLSIGGGIGSFVWVDALRVSGVDKHQVAVISMMPQPYEQFRRLCHHSQLFDADRLRSDSGSTPDNVWGWPGYAPREMNRCLQQGRIGEALRIAWQIFTEPVLAEPYTPRAGDVFASIDQEAARIGWNAIRRTGYAHLIRKTDDERYAVAYAQPDENGVWQHKIILARYIHLATGYNAPNFSGDTEHSNRVVHAYHDHSHVYRHLAQYGGRVIVRGRGIAASQIVQRLADLRAQNDTITLLHILRTPITNEYTGRTQRRIAEHWRLQPFNWPKSSFGGVARSQWEHATDIKRAFLAKALGGTTTAKRRMWQDTIKAGLSEGWYQLHLGEVVAAEPRNHVVSVAVNDLHGRPGTVFEADFMIDATGLDAQIEHNPLLADLCQHYSLRLNTFGFIDTRADFEITNMANGTGRVYAAGVIAGGNSYAPVDSFAGLQYAAQRSADSMIAQQAPGLRRLNGLNSVRAWLRWTAGREP